MTVTEQFWLDLVADLGCIVCYNLGYEGSPANIHHIREGQGMGKRAGDGLTLPLCKLHHQDGGPGVALHADQPRFERLYGDELTLLNQVILLVAARLRERI